MPLQSDYSLNSAPDHRPLFCLPMPTNEQLRLEAANRGESPWRLWGPYLAERQWGTVREDSVLTVMLGII